MWHRDVVTRTAAALVLAAPVIPASAQPAERSTDATESRIPVDGASLHARAIGRDRPVIVLHGGPDFDHGYLLPDLDRLKDAFRLIYYDQRGRGRSAAGHFAYLECGDDVRRALDEFFGLTAPRHPQR